MKLNEVVNCFNNIYFRRRENPPIDPYSFDLSVRSILSQHSMDFDGPSLDRALQSLRTEQEHSSFFKAVLDTNADFIVAWEEKEKKEVEHRNFLNELQELEQRVLQGRHLREVLRREIRLRQYRQDIVRRQQGNL